MSFLIRDREKYPKTRGLNERTVDQRSRLTGSIELWDDFAEHSDGTPRVAMSNHSYLLAGTHSASVEVSDGTLVAVTSGNAAATYTQVELRGPGTRIGCRFAFPSGADNNVAICIGLFAGLMDSSTDTPVQDSPAHLVIAPDHWAYGVWEDNAIDDLRSVFFASPLATDGTAYNVEITIDRTTATAYLLLPDGSKVAVSDPLIGSVDGRYAFIEHFRNSSSSAPPPVFYSWWADSISPAPVTLARSLVETPATVAVNDYTPGSQVLYSAPTSGAAVDADNVFVTYTPSTSKVLVTAQAFVKFFGNVNYFWSILLVSSVVGHAVKVADGSDKSAVPVNRSVVESFLITGLNPGQTYKFMLRHAATALNGAVVQADGPNSNSIIMKAESVA